MQTSQFCWMSGVLLVGICLLPPTLSVAQGRPPSGAARAAQADTSVIATINEPVVELGGAFEYKLEVRAPSGKSIRILEEPDFRPFSVIRRSEGMQSLYRNGVSERTVTVSYNLRARRLGSAIDIAPPVVSVGGEKISPKELTIKVVKRGQAPKKTKKRASEDAVYVDTAISLERDPYVGEQIVLEYDLMINPRKIDAQPRPPSEPNLDDFWIEELNDRAMGSRQVVRIEGQYYEKILLRRYAIYPLTPGEAIIDPMTVPLVKGGFMQSREEIEVSSKPIEFDVKPLPEGAPEDFHEGNVGDWDFLVTSDSLRTRVGRAVTITISAEGTGQAGRIKLPTIEPSDLYRIGESEQNLEQRTQGGQIVSKKSMRYALTPLKEGTITLPALSYSYFEPNSGEYRTKKSPSIAVEVSAGELPPEPEAKKEVISRKRASEQDVMSALRGELRGVDTQVDLGRGGGDPFYRSIAFRGLIAGSLLIMLTLLFRPLFRRLLRPDSPSGRRKAIFKRAQSLLKDAAEDHNEELAVEAIKLYCTNAIGVLKGHMTARELPRRLERLGFDEDVSQELGDVLATHRASRASSRARADERDDTKDTEHFIARASKALTALHAEALTLLKAAPLPGESSNQSSRATSLLLCACAASGALLLDQGLAFAKPQNLSAAEHMEQALAHHTEGDWEAARPHWSALADQLPHHAEVQHGLGVTCLRLEDFGCGLLALERARLLNPRDQDIANNLDVARRMLRVKSIEALRGRSQIIVGSEDFFYWDIARKVNPSVLSILMLLAIWGVIVVVLVRPRIKHDVRRDLSALLGLIALLVVIGCGAALTFRAVVMEGAHPVVLTTSAFTFRDGPSEHAAERSINSPIVPGMRFMLQEERRGWAKIRLPDGSSAWLERDALERVDQSEYARRDRAR